MRLIQLALIVACGCGGAAETASIETLPPSTDRDPPPYTPAPSDAATTGVVVALATSAGTEQGRSVALRFIAAIRDQDRATLERMLAEELYSAQPRLGGAQRPRSSILRVLTMPRSSGSLGPDVPVEAIVDLTHLQVQLLSDAESRIPDGLRPEDIHVSVPLQTAYRTLIGGGSLQRLVLVIRTGGNPRVVAL